MFHFVLLIFFFFFVLFLFFSRFFVLVVVAATAFVFPLISRNMYKKIVNSASVMLYVPTVTRPLGTLRLERVPLTYVTFEFSFGFF